ncbi:hypothetical protein E0L36_11650 [Streptomyces sp. AJS327]|uniref:hypothetical protein n=1 Tax=Streptomyces sp. AJS327 TaxID=2545265 RepID=UPI0015DEB5B4|nr:hypothetical protein [Streptomyces sp. AJS327]MBA0051523.1 hypothetical protein [Streptomyces sp. AJS327]
MRPGSHTSAARHPGDGARARTPNHSLRALLTECEWTQEAFARAIAVSGVEAGLRRRYDRTSVAHWLRGSRPEPRVRALIAEALSRRLGRPVHVTDIGMGGPGPEPEHSGGPPAEGAELPGPAPDVETAVEHPRHRAPRAGAAPGTSSLPTDRLAWLTAPVIGPPRADSPPPAPYRLALASAPRPKPEAKPEPGPAAPGTQDATPARLPQPAYGGRPLARTSAVDVASVREHARFFALQTDRHGGGPVRTPLAAYLSGLVRTLRCGGEGTHHRQLLAGTARLSFLLARVYADEQRHGLAQRAFLTADELAGEADDREGVALIRRALSTQAHELGHHRQSLALAESACAVAPARTAPSTRAYLYAGLAVAEAAGGTRDHALDALQRAERELARAPADLTGGPESPTGEPMGTYQDAALLYQSGAVRTALGDGAGAVRELRASIHARSEGECRARALSRAELAELLLTQGRLDEACAEWWAFLDDCALVRSERVRTARTRVPVLLRPHRTVRCVQRLLVRTGEDA